MEGALSVKISDDFVLLGKKHQREILIFEDQVFDWSDDQLIDESEKLFQRTSSCVISLPRRRIRTRGGGWYIIPE